MSTHHSKYSQTLRHTLLALLALPLVAACVTINVYFPEAAVKDLSEKIESAVAREAGQASSEADEATEGGGGGGLASLDDSMWRSAEIALGTVLHLLGPGDAQAQGGVAAPEITNPAIRQIIGSRGARAPEVDRYKGQGVLGENKDALLEARDLSSLPLPQRAAVQKLIREENADRERMFKEIAAATGADLSTLPQIKATYAETLRQRARSGEWIQDANGQWRQKP